MTDSFFLDNDRSMSPPGGNGYGVPLDDDFDYKLNFVGDTPQAYGG